MTGNHPSLNQLGSLARAAGYRLPLEPLQANGRWYLGTACPDDGPVSRESVEYFPSRKAAETALLSGEWTQRDHV